MNLFLFFTARQSSSSSSSSSSSNRHFVTDAELQHASKLFNLQQCYTGEPYDILRVMRSFSKLWKDGMKGWDNRRTTSTESENRGMAEEGESNCTS